MFPSSDKKYDDTSRPKHDLHDFEASLSICIRHDWHNECKKTLIRNIFDFLKLSSALRAPTLTLISLLQEIKSHTKKEEHKFSLHLALLGHSQRGNKRCELPSCVHILRSRLSAKEVKRRWCSSAPPSRRVSFEKGKQTPNSFWLPLRYNISPGFYYYFDVRASSTPACVYVLITATTMGREATWCFLSKPPCQPHVCVWFFVCFFLLPCSSPPC